MPAADRIPDAGDGPGERAPRGGDAAMPARVRVGMIGLGHFGTAVLAQSMHVPQLTVTAVADRNIESALAAR